MWWCIIAVITKCVQKRAATVIFKDKEVNKSLLNKIWPFIGWMHVYICIWYKIVSQPFFVLYCPFKKFPLAKWYISLALNIKYHTCMRNAWRVGPRSIHSEGYALQPYKSAGSKLFIVPIEILWLHTGDKWILYVTIICSILSLQIQLGVYCW